MSVFLRSLLYSRFCYVVKQQSGAEEACWAHNPEVGGSKPPSATNNFYYVPQLLFEEVATGFNHC